MVQVQYCTCKLWRRERSHSSVGNQKCDSRVPVHSLDVRISPEVIFRKLCPILQGKEQLPIVTLSLLVPIFLHKSRVFHLIQNSQNLIEHKCQLLYSLASLMIKPYHILTPKSDF